MHFTTSDMICTKYFFLLLLQAQQLYCTENLHPLGHPMTAVLFRTAVKGTPYMWMLAMPYKCTEFCFMLKDDYVIA